MEITLQSICQKLGFNPLIQKYDYKCEGHEDDSQKSPFSVLTFEENEFMYNLMFKNNNA